MTEYTMATNFEPLDCAIFVQSTKIGTHETKASTVFAICQVCI